jgi:MoxR-like ATPase
VQQRFEGTERYVATEDLMMAVNAAVTLARPLLVKGEPGTGKTQLAEEVAAALGMPLYRWHVKSTTKAQHGLYEYDAVSRLRDSQLGEAKVHDIRNYILKGRLWEAFESDRQSVLLIDEIDKADIEFPNDLLLELDRMEFYVHETREFIKARHRPVVVITSNNEKELPDAFLRRCFFHFIRFPDAGPEEEALDLGTARLAEAAARRGRAAGGAAYRRPAQGPSAAPRRAAQERAGRAPVRAAHLPAAAAVALLRPSMRGLPPRCEFRAPGARPGPSRDRMSRAEPTGTCSWRPGTGTRSSELAGLQPVDPRTASC